MSLARTRLMRCGALSASLLLWLSAGVATQIDPSQMSGIPRPDPALPDGTVTVRVIRGQFTNNVVDQVVELDNGDAVSTARTDAEGRAEFSTVAPGGEIRVSTDLDGTRLTSQPFAAPERGGVAVMLVGVDPDAPVAAPGRVSFGGESGIQVEVGEENVEVYYLFDVVNTASVPVESALPVVLDLPDDAEAVTALRSSSPQTIVDGTRVELPGPFPPGITRLQVGYILPYGSESLAITQRMPIDLETTLIMTEKVGALAMRSAQFDRQMEAPPDEPGGATYLLGAGPIIPAGEMLSFELIGLPHRDQVGRNVALVLVVGILLAGAWGAAKPAGAAAETAHPRVLASSRERLFGELVKIERQHRTGKIGSTKYASRRRQLMASLERVYRELGELDDGAAPHLTRSGDEWPSTSTG